MNQPVKFSHVLFASFLLSSAAAQAAIPSPPPIPQPINELAGDASRVANALWTSTHSVRALTTMTLSELNERSAHTSRFWIGGLGDYGSAKDSGNTDGYDYSGRGYAAGFDYIVNPSLLGGVSFGQISGTNKADSGYSRIRQDSTMFSLFSRHTTQFDKKNTLFIDTIYSYGSVKNKSDMAFVSDWDKPTYGNWDDSVHNAEVKAGWRIKTCRKCSITPFIGLQYLRGTQDTMWQQMRSGAREFRGGEMQSWSLPVGITYRFQQSIGGDQYLIPEVTAAYIGDISRDNPAVNYHIDSRFINDIPRTSGCNPGRNAFRLNPVLHWIINENCSVSAGYNLEYRSNMTSQTVSGSFSYAF